MSTNDTDLEYGPTPADAQYEHTDIEPTIATKFAVWLTVATMLSAGIVYGTFWLFEGQESDASRAAQTFPLAAGQVREPQGPRLQTQPFKDAYTLRETERARVSVSRRASRSRTSFLRPWRRNGSASSCQPPGSPGRSRIMRRAVRSAAASESQVT